VFDQLYDRALLTLDTTARAGITADLVKLLADDMVMINIYYDPDIATAAVRKGIRGPGPAGSSKQLLTSWNIHEWEMD
jgi:hypothetical protein